MLLQHGLFEGSPPQPDAQVTLVKGLAGRQEMVLGRWTNLKLSRITCSCEYGPQSCGGKSAGVAKRPLKLPSQLLVNEHTRIPVLSIRPSPPRMSAHVQRLAGLRCVSALSPPAPSSDTVLKPFASSQKKKLCRAVRIPSP